jgi:hypothetical protein
VITKVSNLISKELDALDLQKQHLSLPNPNDKTSNHLACQTSLALPMDVPTASAFTNWHPSAIDG